MSLIDTLDPLGGIVSGIGGSVANLGLEAVGSWVLRGTEAALDQVAQLIGQATAPQLESSWFSDTYLQVAAIASLLTLPFLFAAAIQALLRSDLMLLARVAFMYLPMSLLGVSLTAPVIMLLLSATDEMCTIVSGAGTAGGAQLLDQAAAAAASSSTLDGSAFLAFVVGLLALAAALALTLELMVRAAAVYVVVLMLPLAFAALVWPARRIWAIRMVELLVSLILSKFVIVAVLSLAGGAFSADTSATLLTAMALLLLATFAPWALMRLLPFTEVAAAAGGTLRAELPGTLAPIALARSGGELMSSLAQGFRPDADPEWGDPGVYDWGSGAADEDADHGPVEAAGSGAGANEPLDESRQIGQGDSGHTGGTDGGSGSGGGGISGSGGGGISGSGGGGISGSGGGGISGSGGGSGGGGTSGSGGDGTKEPAAGVSESAGTSGPPPVDEADEPTAAGAAGGSPARATAGAGETAPQARRTGEPPEFGARPTTDPSPREDDEPALGTGVAPVPEAGPSPVPEAGPSAVSQPGRSPVPEAATGLGAGPVQEAPNDFGEPDPEHAEQLSDFGPAWHAQNGSWSPMSLGPAGLAEGRVFSIDPPAIENAPEPRPEQQREQKA